MLLDTNAFIWFLRGEKRVGDALEAAISDPEISIKLSVASFWEMTIKNRKGKLPLPAPFASDPTSAIESWCARAAIEVVPILPKHVGHAMKIAFPHEDPFDRLIAATALIEDEVLVTGDKSFSSCPGLRLQRV